MRPAPIKPQSGVQEEQSLRNLIERDKLGRRKMGVSVFTDEYSSPIAASRMFNAMILDSRTLLPKLLPQLIQEVLVIQGEGGPGSIEQMNLAPGGPFPYVKNRIDVVDKENLVCKYTMFEGGSLGEKVESIDYEVKIEGSSDGGCVCKTISKYNTVGEHQLKEEDVKEGREGTIGVYKVVESYLQQNPQAYA